MDCFKTRRMQKKNPFDTHSVRNSPYCERFREAGAFNANDYALKVLNTLPVPFTDFYSHAHSIARAKWRNIVSHLIFF
jgi:hypothetical protein